MIRRAAPAVGEGESAVSIRQGYLERLHISPTVARYVRCELPKRSRMRLERPDLSIGHLRRNQSVWTDVRADVKEDAGLPSQKLLKEEHVL